MGTFRGARLAWGRVLGERKGVPWGWGVSLGEVRGPLRRGWGSPGAAGGG